MKHRCKQCGYEWEGKEDPRACPRCKRYDWKNGDQKEKEDVF